MWGYLRVLGGMGYAGGPIEQSGGWGVGGVPRQTLLMPPICGSLYSMQHAV